MILIKLVLLPLLTCHLVRAETYFDSLFQSLKEAQETLKESARLVSEGLKTLSESVKFVENFIESTVEEDCLYQCPGRRIPVAKSGHVPEANGCGSLGVWLGPEELARPEMALCCDAHDRCYHTCNTDKDDCDRIFRRCLYDKCKVVEQKLDYVAHKKCRGAAKLLYVGTTALGCAPFKAAQESACDCVPLQNDIPRQKNEL